MLITLDRAESGSKDVWFDTNDYNQGIEQPSS